MIISKILQTYDNAHDETKTPSVVQCTICTTKRQYSCFSGTDSDSGFFSGISDLLYLYCDQFVVQSIKWVAMPNDFGMVDNIVQPEWYGRELLQSPLCFLKNGLHIKDTSYKYFWGVGGNL